MDDRLDRNAQQITRIMERLDALEYAVFGLSNPQLRKTPKPLPHRSHRLEHDVAELRRYIDGLGPAFVEAFDRSKAGGTI